jgi:hypothetical protein
MVAVAVAAGWAGSKFSFVAGQLATHDTESKINGLVPFSNSLASATDDLKSLLVVCDFLMFFSVFVNGSQNFFKRVSSHQP